jgi:hypothetical protein
MVALTSIVLKRIGLLFLAIPILVLAAFALGEVAGGDISGLQHVPELALLVALGWLAWRRPGWGGAALITLSLIFAGLYILFFARGFPLLTAIATVALLFAPPLAAGTVFVAASRQAGGDRPSG